MSDVLTIAGYGIRESIRRRVFVVVAILTLLSGALYILGARIAFHDTASFTGAGAMGATRGSHTATLLSSGNILVAGTYHVKLIGVPIDGSRPTRRWIAFTIK